MLNLKAWMTKVTQKLVKGNAVIEGLTFLPTVKYTDLSGQSTEADTYFRNWLAYFVNTGLFSDRQAKVCIGMAWPNSQGTVIGNVYADAPVNGMPAYCIFLYIGLQGGISMFGTWNGEYSYYYIR